LLIGLGLALVALVVLQVVGVRALQSWGVKPARGVLALRAANVTVVVAVVAFALWKMGS
jgi:hypothetical protein